MTSQPMVKIAVPAWGSTSASLVRATALREARQPPPVLGFPARALELRVSGSALRAAVVGIGLALSFTLLWTFLLLGVIGPAAGIR